MKKILLGIMLLSIVVLAGCSVEYKQSVEEQETKAVKENLEEVNRQIGMPFIDDFFEKKMAKNIFELRDNAELVTYAYTTNLDGKFVYLGKAIGFGLPYSVQYTNPQKLIQSDCGNHYCDQPLPQADPNGLYMPEGLSATWLMLVNEKTGEPEIIYTEPSIVVTQSKLPRRLVEAWSLPSDY